jgi:hypothetical protein
MGHPMSGDREPGRIDVPVVLTGYVRPNNVPSFCRDGADFWVETVGWHRHVRVTGADSEASRQLQQAAASDRAWVVCGCLKRGPVPGCDLLEVQTVERVEPFFRRRSEAA